MYTPGEGHHVVGFVVPRDDHHGAAVTGAHPVLDVLHGDGARVGVGGVATVGGAHEDVTVGREAEVVGEENVVAVGGILGTDARSKGVVHFVHDASSFSFIAGGAVGVLHVIGIAVANAVNLHAAVEGVDGVEQVADVDVSAPAHAPYQDGAVEAHADNGTVGAATSPVLHAAFSEGIVGRCRTVGVGGHKHFVGGFRFKGCCIHGKPINKVAGDYHVG